MQKANVSRRQPLSSDGVTTFFGNVRRYKWGWLLALIGVAIVVLSLLPGSGLDDAWTRDLLMTVGSSVTLFAVFYVITRGLDRHLDQVAVDTARQVKEVRTDTAQRVEQVRSEAAASATTLADQVEALRADVDRRLDDVAESVTARLEAEAAADLAAFDSLRTDAPTREALWYVMERAQHLGLVSTRRPPRVNISRASHLYVSVEVDLDDWASEQIQLRVESLNGEVQDWVPWPDEQRAEEILVEVGRMLFKHTSEAFDARGFFVGLADLLEAALSHPERRPAIELCPPQWMVCEWGVIPYDGPPYGVNLQHLQTSPTIEAHVANKSWVDESSWEAAYVAALALFPRISDPWAGLGKEEPPF